jgi:sigma-B regulation protein RsbU (phosphoserine phosphatase)
MQERNQSAKGFGAEVPRALESAYWNIRNLFTEGVTREGLRDLFQRDARETFRFFTRNIDFAALRSLPWIERYPRMVWLVFVSLASRLNPPRRVIFAIAILAALVAIIQSLAAIARPETYIGLHYWFIAVALLLLLLVLELRDKLDLKSDLEIAREIQFGLVPAGPFARGDFEIHCFMRPANTVGGDYYDLIDLGEKGVAVVIGDVAGKGMPAALLMALLQGSLRTLIAAGFRLGELIVKLNDYLCESIPANSLVTLFYGELDLRDGALRYVNAGHNPPFVVRPGRLERLTATATVLGFTHGLDLEVREVRIGEGESVLLFTDGITEAFNLSDEEYGEARLEGFLQRNRGLPREKFIQTLIRDVLQFCGPVRPGDDMTIVVVDRKTSAR